MARTGGITFSAVMVFIGSAFTILVGALGLLGTVISSRSGRAALDSHTLAIVAIVEVIVFFGFGGWGIASGIGLIGTKEWARVSMLVFACLLALICIPAALMIAVFPFSAVSDPNLPPNFMAMMRAMMAFFYGLIAALGAFWLYFFNKKSVKAQFQGSVHAGASAEGDFSGAKRARPLSITIIAWFMLIGSGMVPLMLPIWRTYFPAQTLPVPMLGIFFSGRSAILVLSVLAAAQIVAAVGLLKLKSWGRSLAIWLQILSVVNAVLLYGVPANRAKFEQILAANTASINARMPHPPSFAFPPWFGLAVSLPIVLVILWLLVTRKQAFTGGAGQQPAPQT